MHPLPAFNLPRDARDPSAGKDLGDLPEWNLDDLYTGEDSRRLAADLDWLEQESAAFAAEYEGSLDTLDSDGLLLCIKRYERIKSVGGRIMSYAGLRYYQMTTDPGRAKFLSDMQGRITDLSTPMVFFSLEMNRLDNARLDSMLAENLNPCAAADAGHAAAPIV